MNASADALARALARERRSRKRSEELLENRSRELYRLNQQLQAQNETLAQDKRELALLHQVATFAEERLARAPAFRAFVEAVCVQCAWPVGHVYVREECEDGKLYSSRIWHLPPVEDDRLERFRGVSESITFASGEGLPGRVLASGVPVWIESLADDANFPRRERVAELPFTSAFAVPIKVAGRVVAVAEFFLPDARSRDGRLLRLVSTAAVHLGSAFERHEQELALAEQYARLKTVNAELREAQARLVQQEKLASIGELAAGVAHEINNPMGFITSNLTSLADYAGAFQRALSCQAELLDGYRGCKEHDPSLLRRAEAAAGDDLAFMLEDVEDLVRESLDGAQRVREIVGSLKSFARVDQREMQHADINECVESTLRMAWNAVRYHCTVDRRLGTLPPVRCNPGEINQVIMNLVVNAAQAIDGEGTITVETRHDGDTVSIRVSDTGAGIAPDAVDELFTPFFTTKPPGEGTGLGLSISHGIVERHGGRIDVESVHGEGSIFTVVLPLDGARAAAGFHPFEEHSLAS